MDPAPCPRGCCCCRWCCSCQAAVAVWQTQPMCPFQLTPSLGFCDWAQADACVLHADKRRTWSLAASKQLPQSAAALQVQGQGCSNVQVSCTLASAKKADDWQLRKATWRAKLHYRPSSGRLASPRSSKKSSFKAEVSCVPSRGLGMLIVAPEYAQHAASARLEAWEGPLRLRAASPAC